ncbi:helix-turn-helix domain-containing protein [Streptomyces cyaneus]|uniref:helix-turn-helix domain-containing protein n=1 Tax=Streptomyces cyaneus TaxID=1904 RepID=UPI0013E2D374|nr:helix-turn-helix transcriptional regulator [Streptomyces cyaneus]
MQTTGEPDPQRARDTAEFTAAMRGLKERSGLTYRQLEERADEQGEVLPRSTLADVLRGRTLPRPELLTAFVRACGDGERAAAWLEARETVARRGAAETASGTAADTGSETASEGPRRGIRLGERVLGARVFGVPVLLPASAGLVALVAVTVWALVPSGNDSDTRQSQLPRSRTQIRPVLADGLCLTDGYGARYESLVAVQRPCDEVAPQETTLVPLGGNTFRIRWYHPDHGPGCLTALAEGPGVGLLEPWDDCDRTTPFRIEPSGSDGGGRYSLRVDGRGCVAIKDAQTSEGAEAVVEPCRPKDSQVFVIQPAP